MSQEQLRENRNLSWTIRRKAALIYVPSVPVHNVNHSQWYETRVDYLCLNGRPSDPLTLRMHFVHLYIMIYLELLLTAVRGVRKVTTGITGLWQRSVQSDAAF